jgi:hypothetical protein
LDAAFQAWPSDVVVGTPVTAEEEDADLPFPAHPGAREIRAIWPQFSQYSYVPLSENRLLTLLASGLADDKVEHARDSAIKFVADQACPIAFD